MCRKWAKMNNLCGHAHDIQPIVRNSSRSIMRINYATWEPDSNFNSISIPTFQLGENIIIMSVEELFQQTLFDHILHYGLLVGAIFQLIAIAAIVVIPAKSDEEEEGEHGDAAGSKGVWRDYANTGMP